MDTDGGTLWLSPAGKPRPAWRTSWGLAPVSTGRGTAVPSAAWQSQTGPFQGPGQHRHRQAQGAPGPVHSSDQLPPTLPRSTACFLELEARSTCPAATASFTLHEVLRVHPHRPPPGIPLLPAAQQSCITRSCLVLTLLCWWRSGHCRPLALVKGE